MKKILLCDSSVLKTNLLNEKFTSILLLEDVTIKDACVEKVPLHKYFMTSHKRAREFNSIILKSDNSFNRSMHLSLIKLSDENFFKIIRILEILQDIQSKNPNSNITIHTVYNNYLNSFAKLLNQDLQNIVIFKNAFSSMNTNILKTIVKIFILLMNSFRVCNKSIENIFFLYNDKIAFEFAKPYLDNSLITYPFFSLGLSYKQKKYDVKEHINFKFIVFKELLIGLKNYQNNKHNLLNSNLPLEIKTIYLSKLFELELNSMMILSLKHKYKNLKSIMGLFDTYPSIDYISEKLNTSQNINTICIPHGINFKYKVHYISYGVNTYTFWSKNHFERMEQSNLIGDITTTKVITGNIVYQKTLSHIKEKQKSNKNILVVGEYFSTDDYYSSPFNKEVTEKLFEALKEFIDTHNDSSLTIRTRINDDYSQLASKYISSRIQLSSPDVSMIDEINQNDLIISVFSNALHEALLLEKNVLQVNLLEIENYRDLADDNLLFYADSIEKVKNILNKWYEGNLPKLDYKKHLSDYANDGKFQLLNFEVQA
jgi:hypothetical protein